MTSVCVSLWLARFPLSANVFPQSSNGQTYGLRPMCRRLCTANSVLDGNRAPHPLKGQACGLKPVCRCLCIASCVFDRQRTLHPSKGQEYALTPVCVSLWLARFPRSANVFPHPSKGQAHVGRSPLRPRFRPLLWTAVAEAGCAVAAAVVIFSRWVESPLDGSGPAPSPRARRRPGCPGHQPEWFTRSVRGPAGNLLQELLDPAKR